MAYEYDRFEREEGGGSFLMGLLAGTVLGAGLGMLFAPKTGSDEPTRVGDGQRPQQQAVDDPEDGRVRANAQGERERNRRGEPWRAAQHSQGKPDVVRHAVQ